MLVNSKVKSITYLFRCWKRALCRIMYRSTISLFIDPKGSLQFLHTVLDGIDLYEKDNVLGDANITELVKGSAEPKIIGAYQIAKSSDTRIFMELITLAYLLQIIKPKVVFEIGTFVGRTTRLFALNSPNDSQIYTLDLPQSQAKHVVGEDYKNTIEAGKITQLSGDSRMFDYSSWWGQCDFVWVDACHDYAFVKSDTQVAIKLCRPGGWIGWHDYRHSKKFDGVTRAVQELYSQFATIRHIKGTTIALLNKKY
jgi:predicted O-methyltransferase YrrM